MPEPSDAVTPAETGGTVEHQRVDWDAWVTRKEAVDWAAVGMKLDPAEIRSAYSHRRYMPHLAASSQIGSVVLDTVAGLCSEVERLRAKIAQTSRGVEP